MTTVKTEADSLLSLAERCEHAREPCRQLDNAIRLATNNGCAFGDDPAYTASLDAAMTLVPEEWAYSVGNIDPTRLRCNAHVMPPPFNIGANIRTGTTPAMALCAAALRAKARGDAPSSKGLMDG